MNDHTNILGLNFGHDGAAAGYALRERLYRPKARARRDRAPSAIVQSL